VLSEAGRRWQPDCFVPHTVDPRAGVLRRDKEWHLYSSGVIDDLHHRGQEPAALCSGLTNELRVHQRIVYSHSNSPFSWSCAQAVATAMAANPISKAFRMGVMLWLHNKWTLEFASREFCAAPLGMDRPDNG
jgi:hypothetical protein